MLSLVVIGPQIKEKQRGAQCAPPGAYILSKYPSLNRVYDKFSFSTDGVIKNVRNTYGRSVKLFFSCIVQNN